MASPGGDQWRQGQRQQQQLTQPDQDQSRQNINTPSQAQRLQAQYNQQQQHVRQHQFLQQFQHQLEQNQLPHQPQHHHQEQARYQYQQQQQPSSAFASNPYYDPNSASHNTYRAESRGSVISQTLWTAQNMSPSGSVANDARALPQDTLLNTTESFFPTDSQEKLVDRPTSTWSKFRASPSLRDSSQTAETSPKSKAKNPLPAKHLPLSQKTSPNQHINSQPSLGRSTAALKQPRKHPHTPLSSPRPSSAPITARRSTPKAQQQHSDALCEIAGGYNGLEKELFLLWEEVKSALLQCQNDSYAAKLAALNLPDRSAQLKSIENAHKKVMAISLYKSLLREDHNLPNLVSKECEALNETRQYITDRLINELNSNERKDNANSLMIAISRLQDIQHHLQSIQACNKTITEALRREIEVGRKSSPLGPADCVEMERRKAENLKQRAIDIEKMEARNLLTLTSGHRPPLHAFTSPVRPRLFDDSSDVHKEKEISVLTAAAMSAAKVSFLPQTKSGDSVLSRELGFQTSSQSLQQSPLTRMVPSERYSGSLQSEETKLFDDSSAQVLNRSNNKCAVSLQSILQPLVTKVPSPLSIAEIIAKKTNRTPIRKQSSSNEASVSSPSISNGMDRPVSTSARKRKLPSALNLKDRGPRNSNGIGDMHLDIKGKVKMTPTIKKRIAGGKGKGSGKKSLIEKHIRSAQNGGLALANIAESFTMTETPTFPGSSRATKTILGTVSLPYAETISGRNDSDVLPLINTTSMPHTGVAVVSNTDLQKTLNEQLKATRKIRQVLIQDHDPFRVVNPLLEMPQYPYRGDSSSLPVEMIPTGAEIWNVSQLYLPQLDTFPVSFLARLLGFEVPSSAPSDGGTVDFDPMTVPLMSKKNDCWLDTPQLGEFMPALQIRRSRTRSLCKHDLLEGTDDEELDYVDSMWYTILSTYRGFSENTLKSACIATRQVLSEVCVDLARERLLISSDVSFRFASQGDETVLSCLNKTSTLNSDDINVLLKDQSRFFLIAERSGHGPVGFIHCRLCWYKKNLITIDGTSTQPAGIEKRAEAEVVLYIVDMQYAVCGIETPKNEEEEVRETESKEERGIDLSDNIVLILTSLALEHSRMNGVHYCIIDAPSASASFFATFFRMSQLSSRPSERTDCVPLACDLKKCSFQYAIYLKNGLDKKTSHSEILLDMASTVKERMLVRFPNVSKSIGGSGENDRAFRADNNNDQNEGDGERKRAKKCDGLYTNFKEEGRCRLVHVQVQLSSPAKTRIVSRSDTTAVEVESSSLADFSWDILRTFDLPALSHQTGKKSVEGFTGDNAAKAPNDDEILDELEKNQKNLASLESSVELKLRVLLTDAYQEREKFEHEGAGKVRADVIATTNGYDAILERRKEADLAWQMQLEQDMDAVCDICNDGEVTVDNQILFCEACNVAVHQKCYGIEKVPEHDYFCRACRFFKRDQQNATAARHGSSTSKQAPTPLPICCEMCPRKQGAFAQMDVKKPFSNRRPLTPSKWIHIVCAKWLGLNYTNLAKPDLIEDGTELKKDFRRLEYTCFLCKGMRGGVHKCREPDCTNYLHVTCARASGLCKVVHGENHAGITGIEGAWTLCCPEHSNISPENIPEGSMTVDQLIAAAKAFPPEPMPDPPLKPFSKMTLKERKKALEDPEYESNFLHAIGRKVEGSRCSVCYARDDNDETGPDGRPLNTLSRCSTCETVVHRGCYSGEWIVEIKEGKEVHSCASCLYIKKYYSTPDFETPQCHMCNQKAGALLKASATPQSKTQKRWKDNIKAFKKSLFGKQIWCHSVCGMWHPKTVVMDDGVECSSIIMASGVHHIESKQVCHLCGRMDKIKIGCSHVGCRLIGYLKGGPYKFHLSCARQAGLEVADSENEVGDIKFHLKCFLHARCEYVLRAKLEDMIEVERFRAGNDMENAKGPMSYEHATRIFNWGVLVMQCLGWAWKWSEWWVAVGDNWEPLLEEGQVEANMTKEELRVIDSTPESRRDDARRCRLAAFGAALRNRDYDKEEGDDRVALDRALRAILSTPSLVGPLKKNEIDFFAEWLARVYRSNALVLGFGDNKIPVAEAGRCVHYEDGSPKYALGPRPLPGKQTVLAKSGVDDPDDFLKPEMVE